ncbi:hypothetical protein [Leptospira ellisii]|uniref:hypothetical protein n=1 Tax=Leptospira ellisii TaxID=2023197 RepID=UPI000F63781C|nr:hypothetical protein [Leptospira ellisii]
MRSASIRLFARRKVCVPQPYSEAIEELGDPWRIQTETAPFFLNLAFVYTKLGDRRSAIRAIVEAIERKYPLGKLAADEDLKSLENWSAFQLLLRHSSAGRIVDEIHSRGEDRIELIFDRFRNTVVERKLFAGQKAESKRFSNSPS